MGCCLSCLKSDSEATSGTKDVPSQRKAVSVNLESSFQLASVQSDSASDTAPLLASEGEARRYSSVNETTKPAVYSTVPVVINEPVSAEISPSRNAMLPIFEGIFLELKFTAQNKFANKFVWVDLAKKTFQISDHRNKQKRHKEANLSAIVNVEVIPASVFAGCTTSAGAPAQETLPVCADDVYATVKFVLNDGGVDLKFATTESRDDFVRHLSTVLKRLRDSSE